MLMDDYQILRLRLHTFHTVCWKWNMNYSSWPAVKTTFFFRSFKFISSNRTRPFLTLFFTYACPKILLSLVYIPWLMTFLSIKKNNRCPVVLKKSPEHLFCVIRSNRPINRTLKAYSFSVATTSLKRILDVRVWPWYTMGSPSLPSQQSTSTQRQPLFSALCAHAANEVDQS